MPTSSRIFPAALVSVAAALAGFGSMPAQAASTSVPTGKLKVFHLDSRQIVKSGGADSILDMGFIPPNGSQIYWLQPGLGRQHLYVYSLANGTQKELPRLLPDNHLPDALSWSPDGGHVAFVDRTQLIVTAVADGSSRTLDLAPSGLESHQLYWMDSGQLMGMCGYALCQVDLYTGKSVPLVKPKFRVGLPELQGYYPSTKTLLWEAISLDSPSAMYLSGVGGGQLTGLQQLRFPPLNAGSSISATRDGTYIVTDTNIGNSDGPVALFIGNTKTGIWARLSGGKAWGANPSARISPQGDWIVVLVSPDGDVSPPPKGAFTYLYLAKLPRSLLQYLDGKSRKKQKKHRK